MKKKIIAAFLFVLVCAAGLGADGKKGYKLEELNIGYMPQDELGKRVSVEDLADYVKSLRGVCEDFFAGATTPVNLDVVVAARPDGKSRVWFVAAAGEVPAEQLEKLRAKLEGVAVPKIYQGAIGFAMDGTIAGGAPKAPAEPGPPPVPAEWKEALSKLDSKERMSFDDVLAVVWPGSKAAAEASEPPPGFVKQVLEPTGGHMLRPKDWYYREDHKGTVLSWTISQEDPSKGKGYVTGVHLQAYMDVKKSEGKPAKEFIADFAEAKKKEATKVIKACDPEDQGLFSRECLEVEVGQRHILYSLFWGNGDLDLAVIISSESTKEKWESVAPTFDKMNAVELIDLARFQPGGEDDFKVPPGVKYKEAPPELNEAAKKLLMTKFSPKATDEEVLAMFQPKVICGPGLWAELKGDKSLSKIEKGEVVLHVDTETLEGKLFESNDDILLFWKAFAKKVPMGDFKIRRLNENELTVFWSIISFDIEEPVYILESGKQKILVYFGGEEKTPRIFWIDDLDNVHLKGMK